MDINNQISDNMIPPKSEAPSNQMTQEPGSSGGNYTPAATNVQAYSEDGKQLTEIPKPVKKNIVLFIGIIFFIVSILITAYFLFFKGFVVNSLKI